MSCENTSSSLDTDNDLPATAWQDSVDRRRSAPTSTLGAWHRGMERLAATRINSWLGLACDTGVAIALLVGGFRLLETWPMSSVYVVLAGVFAFSFVEYCFHRWLFHGSARIFEQGHNRHHELPLGHDSLPFFFAPLAILALAGLVGLVASKPFAMLFTGGFAAGYAAYGLSHTVIHHMRFRSALIRRWAAAHHIHHHHPDSNFGVTSPLWDILMRTRYARRGPQDSI